MLAFPLLAGTTAAVAALAWQATWLQLAGHALAKSAMFMAAGNLLLATGASRLEGLTGTSRRLPLSLLTFGLAAVTLMGLPPARCSAPPMCSAYCGAPLSRTRRSPCYAGCRWGWSWSPWRFGLGLAAAWPLSLLPPVGVP